MIDMKDIDQGALNAAGEAVWRACADHDIILVVSQQRDVALAAIKAYLAAVPHTITPRAPEPKLKVGQVWKMGKDYIRIQMIFANEFLGLGINDELNTVMIAPEFRAWIARTGAKLVEG